MGTVGDRLVLAGYKSMAAVARAMPSSVSHSTAELLSRTTGPWLRDRRAVVARNLRRVDPTLKGPALDFAVQRAFDSYARYWVDSFRVPDLTAAEISKPFTRDGEEHLHAGLARGKGLILAMPHLGGWEWAGRWVTDVGWRSP